MTSIVIKQNKQLAEKCANLMKHVDEDYLTMMNDKISADNNLYKVSLEKSVIFPK